MFCDVTLYSISGKRSFFVVFGGAHTTYSLPIFTVVCQVLRGLDRRLLVHCTVRHSGQPWFFKAKLWPFDGRFLVQSGPADNRFLTWQSHSAGCQFWLICRLTLATPSQETSPNCFFFPFHHALIPIITNGCFVILFSVKLRRIWRVACGDVSGSFGLLKVRGRQGEWCSLQIAT